MASCGWTSVANHRATSGSAGSIGDRSGIYRFNLSKQGSIGKSNRKKKGLRPKTSLAHLRRAGRRVDRRTGKTTVHAEVQSTGCRFSPRCHRVFRFVSTTRTSRAFFTCGICPRCIATPCSLRSESSNKPRMGKARPRISCNILESHARSFFHGKELIRRGEKRNFRPPDIAGLFFCDFQRAEPVWSKKSKPPIFKDLPGDRTVARRPLHELILLDELEANAGVHLRFG